MARLRQNFQEGTITNNPLAIGGTSLTSAELASLTAVTGADVLAITLDPGAVHGAPEIIHVTAHTALATSATILRAREGTTARAHPAATVWEHNITEDDFDYDNLDNLPAPVVVPDAAPIALRPALWLPVDEGAIGVAAAATSPSIEDYSGHNRDGAVNGNPTYQVSIVNGYPIVRLDGTGDFFSCGNVLSYERNNAFSAFLVGNFSTTNAYLYGKESNATGRGWGILSLSDKLSLRLVSTVATNELRVDGSTNITALGFYLATVIYDGTSAPGGISLRVNGVAETPTTVVNNLSATIVDATVPLCVGARQTGVSAITGDFAEGLVFSRALNTTDRDAMETYLMDKYGL